MSTPVSPSAGRATPPAASALLERHGAHLRAYLATLPGADARRVEDVMRLLAQELAGAGELDDEPAVWLFTRARRQLVGTGQRGESLQAEEHDAGEGDEGAERQDPAVAVHRAFGRLTTKQQEALRLRWQFGFTLEEMARVTGLSSAGMDVLLQNALSRVVEAFSSAAGRSVVKLGNPRLLAYALDEMGAAEKRAFVESVADGKELLETAEAIRRAVRTLTRIIQNGAPPPRRRRRRRSAGGWVAAVLALLVIGGGVGWWRGAATEEVAPASSRPARTPADPSPDNAPAVGRESTISWRTAGKRERRPGEADWEKKPFGRGQGESAGLVGDGQGGGDAPAEAGDLTFADLEGSPDAPADEASVETNDSAEEVETEETSLSVLTLAAGAGGAGGGAGLPKAGPAAASGAAAGSTWVESRTVPAGDGQSLAPEQKSGPAGRPLPADFRERKRPPAPGAPLRMARGGSGGLPLLAPPEPPLPVGSEEPVAVQTESAPSPFEPGRDFVRVVVQARPVAPPSRPAANLVLAIDVSASMDTPNRLPLVREGVRLLAGRLRPDDRVAVVSYAAAATEARASAPIGAGGRDLRACLDGLTAGGRTNGHEGLVRAYEIARAARTETGLNAVILCTDGNFNLGETDDATLAALAQQAASEGIRLSVFGFGRSDRNDLRLELLARHGGGQSCYVNTADEAERLLAGQIEGLLEPTARDVVARVAFASGPAAGARLRGGVGEAAALLPGRSLALLYDIETPSGLRPVPVAGVVQVDYQSADSRAVRLRQAIELRANRWARTSPGFRFAVALAELERVLHGERADAAPALDRLETWVKNELPDDIGGYRQDLLETIALTRGTVSE